MIRAHYDTIQALNCRVTFLPGSWDKRFARDMHRLGEYDLLTPRQQQQIERMAYRYRRQLNTRGFVIPIEVLEPHVDRLRQEKTPDNIKYHWVKERTNG